MRDQGIKREQMTGKNGKNAERAPAIKDGEAVAVPLNVDLRHPKVLHCAGSPDFSPRISHC